MKIFQSTSTCFVQFYITKCLVAIFDTLNKGNKNGNTAEFSERLPN